MIALHTFVPRSVSVFVKSAKGLSWPCRVWRSVDGEPPWQEVFAGTYRELAELDDDVVSAWPAGQYQLGCHPDMPCPARIVLRGRVQTSDGERDHEVQHFACPVVETGAA